MMSDTRTCRVRVLQVHGSLYVPTGKNKVTGESESIFLSHYANSPMLSKYTIEPIHPSLVVGCGVIVSRMN